MKIENAFQNVDSQTQLVGLLGWPVAHSLSPVMHNAAFAALGLNWCYVPLPVPPEEVANAVSGLTAMGFKGANVTVPHKESVLPTLSNIVPNARELGAVNTLVLSSRQDGVPLVTGHNTDDRGFIGALRQGGCDPRHKQAVVVGAGGAARAVVFGLLWSNVDQVTVFNRNMERAETLKAELGQRCEEDAKRIKVLPLEPETLIETCRTADLLVNATSVGMAPQPDESIWPAAVPLPQHLTVFDLVYAPLETRLLAQTKAAGANPIDGLGMLVRQGAIASQLWTGQGVIDEISATMRQACERALSIKRT